MIAGRYRLESRLGGGGGGTVWRCVDQKLDAIVALKILDAEGDLERWRREVAMARRIAHRNVCRVHDLGDTAELRYVTMELVEGTSLRSRVRPDLPAAEARALIEQIVAGTAAIHAAGVVHRDLKPENIVVATDGRAVIVDFGLARAALAPRPRAGAPQPGEGHAPPDAATLPIAGHAGADPLRGTVTHAGVVVGTPRYMSPEQAAGEPVDARTDVWALGLIAHELLTGVLPVPDEHGRRVADAVAWAPILRRCLALAPEERFADARALQVALAPPRRRWPWLVAGGGVAAAAIAAVVALGGSRPADDTPAPAAPYRMIQLTTTATHWPGEAPSSVAISPDAQRFAYTTGGAKLYVRELAGGDPRAWPVPKYVRPSSSLDRAPRPQDFTRIAVAGWFRDGSIAVVGSSETEDHLYRVREAGAYELVYSSKARVRAAVSPVDDALAIAEGGAIVVVRAGARSQVAAVADGMLALAWSPDGRLAYAHGADEIAIDLAGGITVWRGKSAARTPLLAWVAADRLAFTYEDPDTHVAHLLGIDARTGAYDSREHWSDQWLGAGSAAHGIVLLVRGTATHGVHVRNGYGHHVEPVDPEATRVVGWTADGRVVLGDPIAAAARAGTWTSTPWPGVTPGDVADAVAGDHVIVHRVDPADARARLVDRIGPAGERAQLARIDDDTVADPVRCAGDTAPPCVLEQLDGDDATWRDFDPVTGAIGAVVHRRPAGDHAAALSHDGAVLAIVEGDRIVLVDRATHALLPRPPTAAPGTALRSVSFAPNGDLYVTADNLLGRASGVGVIHLHDTGYGLLFSTTTEPLRSFARPVVRADGTDVQLAVPVRDLHVEVWRADGI